MDKQQFLALIDKYLEGEASMEEEQMLLNYYGSFQDITVWDEKVLGVKQEIAQKMLDQIQDHIKQSRVKAPVRLWPRIAVAAAVVAAIVFGVWFFSAPRHANTPRHAEFSSASQDIAPGKNTATLTLANGKVISLSDAKTGVVVGASGMKYNDGEELQGVNAKTEVLTPKELRSKTVQDDDRQVQDDGKQVPDEGRRVQDDGKQVQNNVKQVQDVEVSTPRGGTYQITLPDGTKVWLNAASSLKFPSAFNELGKRKVELSGEAYFEVAKDKAHPFIVSSTGQDVEVLGTHFNINAYKDEASVKTTLLEGSVRVSLLSEKGRAAGKRRNALLKPNQQAVLLRSAREGLGLSGSEQIEVKEEDGQGAIDWKEGAFVFKKASLDEIMKKVTRWYDVEIVDLRKQKTNITFSGKMSRYDNISKVLSKLALTGEVRFRIEGRKIIIE